MPAVHKTVVHFQAHAQRLTAICRDIFAPGDAGNAVVLIKVSLVGATGQVEPRCTGKIDQIVQLSALVQKGLLGFAFGTGGAAEAVQIALLRQRDDVELLAAGLQVGEAGHALVQQPDLPAADGIAEVLHGVDRIGHQIPQRIVKGFFIIDEINRGNMSKIFGELLMLIEADYRETKTTLAYNGLSFSVPKRLHIIGMMNTADRSLAMIDYALRRRFSFFDMEPGFDSEGFIKYQEAFANDTFNTLIDRINELNREIANDKSLGKGFCIGHSYFCNTKECTDEWMQDVVDFDILPMLAEYWFDDTDKLQRWENILHGVFQ